MNPATPALLEPTCFPAWRRIAAPCGVAIAAICCILGLAATGAALRGPWLDEFWTLQLGNADRGLASLVREGWLHDTHPPMFNAWSTLLAQLGVSSIPMGRLVSNLLAVALAVVALQRLCRRGRVSPAFALSLLLLVLPLSEVLDSFATYRSYFWQAAAVTVLVGIARHVAETPTDLDFKDDRDLIAVTTIAGGASIALHFVGGVFGGLLCGLLALSAWRRSLRRWVALLLTVAGAATLFIVFSVLLQSPHWAADLDQSWIDTTFEDAASLVGVLIATTLLINPLALLGLRAIVVDAAERRFATVVAGAAFAGLALILAVHLVHPVVVERYLIAAQVMTCAVLAIPASRLYERPALFAGLAAAAIVAALVPTVRSGTRPLWNEGADAVGRIVSACPSTRVFAASGWAVGPAPETRAALREDPVFELAYRTLAAARGFEVEFIGQNGSVHVGRGDPCPIVLWVEHTPNDTEKDPEAAILAAGLSGLDRARLSVVRTRTGIVIRAEQPMAPETAALPETDLPGTDTAH